MLSCKQYCHTCRGKVVIIGAGPAGSTAAILLSKRGYSVEVYERRPQPKHDPIDLKRTYIIALSERGLKAMRAAGVCIPSDAPYKGFVRHLKGGKIQVMTVVMKDIPLAVKSNSTRPRRHTSTRNVYFGYLTHCTADYTA